MRITAAIAVFIGIALLFYLGVKPSRELAVESATEPSINFDDESKRVSNGPVLSNLPVDSQALPELIGSVHDYGLQFRETAHRAAEELVGGFDPISMVRWRSVRLDPTEILDGSYLDKGAMPKSFQITPFPDTTFTVVESRYTIRSFTESAVWEGTVSGTDSGRVEISIVGGIDDPAFVIKIFNHPQFVSISATGPENAYVAIEGNPFQPEATL